MDDQSILRLEQQLEKLIEGGFARVFGKRVRAQDIALQLSRAMEDNVIAKLGDDPRPVAPDEYHIHMHPEAHTLLTEKQPRLPSLLSQHVVELATAEGFRLEGVPTVMLLPDTDLDRGVLRVEARHLDAGETAAMQRPVTSNATETTQLPHNPQLLIEGQGAVALESIVINIGRSRTNEIVLDDPTVSRHHVQLRLRFGYYMLFDTRSRGGTLVNDVRVKEHRLQPGDVISIGQTRIVYLEDEHHDEPPTGPMELFD